MKNKIIYQILNYAFCDGSGDGVGDFKGISQKLEYLRNLNVNYLWISPIHKATSYHGYDIEDYESVSPYLIDGDFDLQNLINEAKKYKINIMLDIVMNHTSINHVWFQSAVRNRLGLSADETYKDYYMFSNVNPNQNGWCEYRIDDKSVWYYASFSESMPDLNYNQNCDFKNDVIFNYMINLCKKYIDMGVMGLRLDGIMHIYEHSQDNPDNDRNARFLEAFCNEIKAYNSEVFIVGEALVKDERIAAYSNNIDSLFNFPVANQLKNLFWNSGDIVNYHKQISQCCKRNNQAFQLANLISSHDTGTGRFANEVGGGDFNKNYIAAMINILFVGIPVIYYGDEIGLVGEIEYSRNDYPKNYYLDIKYRTQMPWNSFQENDSFVCDNVYDYNGNKIFNLVKTVDTLSHKTIEDELKQDDGLLNFYQKLTSLKIKYSELFDGEFQDIYTSWLQSKILAFKAIGNEKLLVLINIDENERQFSLVEDIISLETVSKNNVETRKNGNELWLAPISVTVIKLK